MIEADCEYDKVIITMSLDEAEALLRTATAQNTVSMALRAAIRHAIDETPYLPEAG